MKLHVQGPDALVVPGVGLREPDRPAGRHASSTRRCSRARRDPVRPHGHAARRGRLPRRDGRRLGDARPRVAPRAGPCGRAGPDRRRDAAGRSAWACGARARGTSCRRSPTTTCRTTRSAYMTRRARRRRRGAAVRPADQLRRRARLGAVRADGAGRPSVGRSVGGRARARPDRRRARRVRLAAAREGLPAVGPGHLTPSTTRSRRGSGSRCGKDKDFQGRAALEAKGEPAERLACMTFDDPRTVVMGKEPIRHDGRVVVVRDERGVRLHDRARHRLRLPAGGARGRGHARRGRVLRRTLRGHGDAPSRCSIPRAND